jgi:hypothetical protein
MGRATGLDASAVEGLAPPRSACLTNRANGLLLLGTEGVVERTVVPFCIDPMSPAIVVRARRSVLGD